MHQPEYDVEVPLSKYTFNTRTSLIGPIISSEAVFIVQKYLFHKFIFIKFPFFLFHSNAPRRPSRSSRRPMRNLIYIGLLNNCEENNWLWWFVFCVRLQMRCGSFAESSTLFFKYTFDRVNTCADPDRASQSLYQEYFFYRRRFASPNYTRLWIVYLN